MFKTFCQKYYNIYGNMSLAKMKAKENRGKQKLLPKLKTILACPYKKRSPTLEEDELERLQEIISTSIVNSGIERTKYATCKHICLGLESSLRAINNQQSACVFISLNIKPNHIVSLIARNAEVKDNTQPAYAQPCLEDFTEKLFGVRALCMVLPKDLKAISIELWKWVEQRRKPKVVVESKITPTTTAKNKKFKKTHMVQTESIKNDEIKERVEEESKSFQGDFISFNDSNVDLNKLQLNDNKIDALDALSLIMDKVPRIPSQSVEKSLPMEIECTAGSKKTNEPATESDDSIDFLDVYKPLVVHKIKPNPNKKPKKKRNKNKIKNVKK